MEKKYKLTEETTTLYGRTLYRIEAIRNFGDVKAGERGGFVESEGNLSQDDKAWVCGDAKVYGNAKVCGDAWVYGNADYIVFKNWWSSGRYFTWTRSNNKWKVGCFYGTGEELIKKAYADSEISGREYERIVKYIEGILTDNGRSIEDKH